jgi:hypothetical protein
LIEDDYQQVRRLPEVHPREQRRGQHPVSGAEGVISRRLSAIGMGLVFVGTARVLEAAGVEYAVGDCLVAAAVATLLTAA